MIYDIQLYFLKTALDFLQFDKWNSMTSLFRVSQGMENKNLPFQHGP